MAFRRHFLALQPDDAARAALAAVPLPAGARVVHPQDLHLTLAFLDTLDAGGEARAREAAGVLVTSWRGAPPEVMLDGLEYWRGPGILCAVASRPPDPLATLAGAVSEVLQAVGLPVERRPFRSHVTLARKVPRGVAPHRPLPGVVAWRAGHVALMASTGTAAVPRYAVLGAFHFSTNAAD